jgi:glycosyltransferase involved in cell wall biosynthesis
MSGNGSSRRVRHCMIVDNTYPDPRVEREALALARRGHDVDVVCLGDANQPARQRDGRITVYRVPLRRQRGMGLGVQLREYLAFMAWATALVTRLHLRHRYDVVQAHNVPDFLVFSAIVPKLTGAKILLDLHDLMPEFFASRTGDGMNRWSVRLVRWQERLSTAFADHVLTVTDLWRSTLIDRGVPADKVDVVMNLPDEAVFAVREPVIRPDPRPFTLIHHGTITHRYGIDLLIRAVARLRDRDSVRLIIHGRGEAREGLEALVRQLGVEDVVHWSTYRLATSELPELITQADVGVIPYRRDVFTDGILPTKLMEYAALGIPVISVRTTAVETYFSDRMVRYIEPDSVEALVAAIEELRADPALRRSLADEAQSFSRHHRWSVDAQRYGEIVERLAGSGPLGVRAVAVRQEAMPSETVSRGAHHEE